MRSAPYHKSLTACARIGRAGGICSGASEGGNTLAAFRGRLLSTEELLSVAKQVHAEASARGTPGAILGGLAMSLYGSDRLTKGVDFVSDRPLDPTLPGLVHLRKIESLVRSNRQGAEDAKKTDSDGISQLLLGVLGGLAVITEDSRLIPP